MEKGWKDTSDARAKKRISFPLLLFVFRFLERIKSLLSQPFIFIFYFSLFLTERVIFESIARDRVGLFISPFSAFPSVRERESQLVNEWVTCLKKRESLEEISESFPFYPFFLFSFVLLLEPVVGLLVVQ